MLSTELDVQSVVMPCGAQITLNRPRSVGVLARNDAELLDDSGVHLSFDPLQMGWVPAAVQDDLAVHLVGHSHAPSVKFRKWQSTDIDRYLELLDVPEIWEHLPEDYPAPLDRQMARDLIDLSVHGTHHDVRAVALGSDVIGQVRLEFGSTDTQRAEISYWLGRQYWGQGLGSAMVRAFARQSLRDHAHLSGLFARVKRGNTASARILAKAGFVDAGLDPQDVDWQILTLNRR